MEKEKNTPAPDSIRNLPEGQKPRERLLSLGPDRLSDRELITLLLSSGGPGHGASAIADDILQAAGGDLKKLLSAHPTRILSLQGMGRAKYCSLAAALELGRRMALRPSQPVTSIRNSRQAWETIREHIPGDGKETIIALLLDNRNRVLGTDCVSGKRHHSGCDLDLRRLLSSILFHNASGVILAHNHPSGEEQASREDVRMTRDLAGILSGMGTELIDHLIITDEGYQRIHWAA